MNSIEKPNFVVVNSDSKYDKKKLSNYYSQVLNITLTKQDSGFWYNISSILVGDENP